jgi:hypothetical protein
MKGKFVLRVLSAIGILALSATVAQAGDGGKLSPLTSFFVCHSINGSSPGLELEVESQVFPPAAQKRRVKIGNGTLACAWAKLFIPQTGQAIDPNPPVPPDPIAPGTGPLSQMKCYTVSIPRKTSGAGTYNVIDSLFGTPLPLWGPPASGSTGTEQNVQVSEIRLICGPANLETFVP